MIKNKQRNLKVGVFDSGVGGLSVLRTIRKALPDVDLLFFADQAHVPYGKRPLEEIRTFSEQITMFLLSQDVDMVVVACNTASAAALKYLRSTFPSTPIVGMEPAVKPAAERSRTRAVGVLATPATFQGELYQSLVHKYGEGLQIEQDTCAGLVEQIENGNLNGTETRQILEKALQPMLEKQVDTVVLGCTHYPFILPLIQKIAGDKITVIDPAPAVARRVRSLAVTEFNYHTSTERIGNIIFYTSGTTTLFEQQIQSLLGYRGEVKQLKWQEGSLHKNF